MSGSETTSASRGLFEEVVAACGLPVLIGPPLVRRALEDKGVSVDRASPGDYRAALPNLCARLKVYCDAAEVDAKRKKIARLLDAYSKA